MSVDSNTPVDPRVQIELEKLNTATDNINKYEVELDDAKSEFKRILTESVEKIKQSAHKLSNSIQAAKPYYEARLYAAQLSKESQQAACNYEKAKSIHAAAKEMVYLAEQGLGEKSTLDMACQEMLSHAASRVNQSQLECTDTRNLLKISELKQEVANNRVSKLQSQLKSAIKASRPYYETRANYNGLLKLQKEKITTLENKVSESKMTYNEALKNLEHISEEIHRMRQEKNNLNNLNQKSNTPKTDELKEQKTEIYENSPPSSEYNYSSQIDSCDEYLDFPKKLTTNASPIRQKRLDQHDCPHLLRDFEFSNVGGTNSFGTNCSSDSETVFSPCRDLVTTSKTTKCGSTISNLTDDIEQWTEIRLSNSESTSSSYSHHSIVDDQTPPGSDDTSSSDDNRKVTCTTTTVFNIDDHHHTGNHKNHNSKKKSNNNSGSGGGGGEGITTWITRSSSFKSSGRRQSLDILIDASDRVKDVFASSFQRVGKTLERRNSESEVNNENNDFFMFSRSEKDTLSDEQVENLLLNDDDCVLKNVNDISK